MLERVAGKVAFTLMITYGVYFSGGLTLAVEGLRDSHSYLERQEEEWSAVSRLPVADPPDPDEDLHVEPPTVDPDDPVYVARRAWSADRADLPVDRLR